MSRASTRMGPWFSPMAPRRARAAGLATNSWMVRDGLWRAAVTACVPQIQSLRPFGGVFRALGLRGFAGASWLRMPRERSGRLEEGPFMPFDLSCAERGGLERRDMEGFWDVATQMQAASHGLRRRLFCACGDLRGARALGIGGGSISHSLLFGGPAFRSAVAGQGVFCWRHRTSDTAPFPQIMGV